MSGNGATQRRVLRLDPRDNALVALTDLRKSETVSFDDREYVLLSDVPAKHKFVTEDLPAGGEVIMYGVLVGRTSEPLRRGGLLSTRNLAGRRPMSRAGGVKHFLGTKGRMVCLARAIIGSCFRWFSAKTGTWPF